MFGRPFKPRLSWAWELQHVGPTPYEYPGRRNGAEAPFVAMFRHVARDQNGTAYPEKQCTYPNETPYTLEQLQKIEADPVGVYKHGMSPATLERAVDALGRAIRLNDAVTAFTAATDAELDALMPPAQRPVVVLAAVPTISNEMALRRA